MNTLTNINGDWFSTMFHVLVVAQILVTTVIAPMMLVKYYNHRIELFNSDTEIVESAKKRLLGFQTIIAFVAAFLISVAIMSISNHQELFNWDNQGGLTVMFLIAYIPVLFLVSMEKKLNLNLSAIRSASLKRKTWHDFIPGYAIALLALGNLIFVAATVYYMLNPFEGFGGAFNFVGLVFLNTIMAISLYVCMNGRHLQNIEDPNKRNDAKQLGISINLFIWILALFHITLSLVLAGLDLRHYSLLLQSVYFQVIFIASIQIFCRRSLKLNNAGHEKTSD